MSQSTSARSARGAGARTVLSRTARTGATSGLEGSTPIWLRGVSVVLVALVIGGATSFAQLIPGSLNWVANSVTGWTIPLIILLLIARLGPVGSAVLGALSLPAMCAGYAIVSTLRGHPDNELSWMLIGLWAGALLGLAASLLRFRAWIWRALGGGVIAGVLIGDAIYGFLENPLGWVVWLIALVAAVLAIGAGASGVLSRMSDPGTRIPISIAALVIEFVLGMALGGAYVVVMLTL